MVSLWTAAVVVVSAAAGVAAVLWLLWLLGALWDRRCQRRGARDASEVTVLVPPQVEPYGGLVFWRTMTGALLPGRWRARLPGAVAHLVFEYRAEPSGITIVVWVPGTVSAAQVASAVRAAWPGSRTTITPARPPTGEDSAVRQTAGGELRLARPDVLPLGDPVAGDDPVRGLLSAPGRLGRGESVRVQVLARPVSAARMARAASGGSHSLLAAFAGRLLTGLVAALMAVVAELVGAATPAAPGRSSGGARSGGAAAGGPAGSSADGTRRPPGPQRVMDSAADRAIAAKLGGTGAGYVVAVRYAVTTPVRSYPPPPHRGTGHAGTGHGEAGTADLRAAARARSRAVAHRVASAFAVHSGHNHFRRRRLRRPARTLDERRLRGGDLMGVAELAALAHLPTDEHLPGLRRAGAAAVAPPPQIRAPGPGVRPVGDSDAVPGRSVGLSVPDARHHLHVVGPTGTGKSTLLAHQVLADAEAGRASVLLDPKGDLVEAILPRLPAPARARTVLIDPTRPLRTRGGPVWPVLNPLSPHPRSPVLGRGEAVGDAATEHVVTIFSRIFAAAWGFRSDDLLRVACLTLRTRRAMPGLSGRETPSLAALPALLSDPATRARAVDELPATSPLREFWSWFESLSEHSRGQIAAPLLNKLRALLLRPFAAHVLCAGRSTVDLNHLLDHGGLLLVRLPKLLGEDSIRLIGSLIVAQVWQAALTRAAMPEHARRDVALILDECQNFLNLPFRIEDMLAEARGFRLSLTLAHQHLGQLTPELRDGIASNARSKLIFRSAPDDATRLARHTLPELNAHDLAHLDAFHAAARLMADNTESRAFTLVTRDLPPVIEPIPRPAPRPAPRPGPRSVPRPVPRSRPARPPQARRVQVRPPQTSTRHRHHQEEHHARHQR